MAILSRSLQYKYEAKVEIMLVIKLDIFENLGSFNFHDMVQLHTTAASMSPKQGLKIEALSRTCTSLVILARIKSQRVTTRARLWALDIVSRSSFYFQPRLTRIF